jgi:hypothetical protein
VTLRIASFSIVKGVVVLAIAAVALVLGMVFAFRNTAYHDDLTTSSVSTTQPA